MGVRFETDEIFEYENLVSYQLQNFIADFGGYLGLCLGCSLLSIIEIFYLFSSHFMKKKNKVHSAEDRKGNEVENQRKNEIFIVEDIN